MKQLKEYEYVDLGLPSGLKWAKSNVGAASETDYGDYFMWGSTTPNNDTPCDWNHAPFNNGSNDYDDEYFNTHKSEWLDGKNNLKPEYDAAYKATNGMGRMPTSDEFQELYDNTYNEWIENFNGTGVNGRKFTSKTKGNSIFIPASGYCLGSSFRGQDRGGDVWSSSLNATLPGGALELGFGSYTIYMGDSGRYYGLAVRGVMD